MDTVRVHEPMQKNLKRQVNSNQVKLAQALDLIPNAHKTHSQQQFYEFELEVNYNEQLELKHDEIMDDHQRLKYS